MAEVTGQVAGQVMKEAFSVSDSIFLVLLIGLAGGTWWLINHVLRTNNEREKRYIDVIDTQAKSLQTIEETRNDVKEIKTILMTRRDVG